MNFEASRHTIEIELDRPHPAGDPTLDIVEWRAAFGSELVLCDGEGLPLADLPPQTSVRDVHFTAFVTWAGFDPADVHLADAGHETYRPVLAQVRATIERYLADRARERTSYHVTGRNRRPVIPRGAGRELPSRAGGVGPSTSQRLGTVLLRDDRRPTVPAYLPQASPPADGPAA